MRATCRPERSAVRTRLFHAAFQPPAPTMGMSSVHDPGTRNGMERTASSTASLAITR